MTDPKQQVTLTFTVEELTAILNIVAELPYSKSAALIHSIQAQSAPQVANQESKAE